MANQETAASIVRAATKAADLLIRHEGEAMPQLVIVGPTRRVYRMPFGWADGQEKEQVLALARIVCIAKQAEVAVSVIEAWVSRVPDGLRQRTQKMSPQQGLDYLNDLGLVPSMQPDRSEVVLVSAVYRDEASRELRTLAATYPLLRDATGKALGLGENMTADGAAEMVGITFGLLPTKPPSRTEIVRAERAISRLPPDFLTVMGQPG